MLDERGTETVAAQVHVTQHAWGPIEAVLTLWARRVIRLKRITDVGREDHSGGDRGAWAGMRVERLKPEFTRALTSGVECEK